MCDTCLRRWSEQPNLGLDLPVEDLDALCFEAPFEKPQRTRLERNQVAVKTPYLRTTCLGRYYDNSMQRTDMTYALLSGLTGDFFLLRVLSVSQT